MIHALGDARISPPVIGWISDRWSMTAAFQLVGLTFLLGGLLWLWGAKYLARDTAAVEDTLPRGLSLVTYQVQAVRSTAEGQPATFIVNFGVTSPRAANATPFKAAA